MQKGYTLIELLAASAIFAGMMVVAVGIFSVSASQEGIMANRRAVNQSSRASVESIIREVANSKNEYDDSGDVIYGSAGFVIANWDGQTNTTFVEKKQNINNPNTVSGNAIVVAYSDGQNRLLKAYYLCHHQTVANGFSLGVKELNISNYQDPPNPSSTKGWQTLQGKIACDNNWKKLTSNDVIIKSIDDLDIAGYYPEAGLKRQPMITVTLTSTNALGTQTAEKASSTYRATIVQRDYGEN